MRPLARVLAVLAAGCSPPEDVAADPEPRGELVIDGFGWQLHRDGDRVELVPDLDELHEEADPEFYRRCGYLTARAIDDIQAWTDRLDPAHDYHIDAAGCTASDNFDVIHLSGFEYSPFPCGLLCCGCCAPALSHVMGVYNVAITNLFGESIRDETGAPYVAIDPDRPCSM